MVVTACAIIHDSENSASLFMGSIAISFMICSCSGGMIEISFVSTGRTDSSGIITRFKISEKFFGSSPREIAVLIIAD